MFISLNVLGSLVLDFETNRLDVSFLNSSGVVQDTFAMVKDSSARPFAPTRLSATAGASQVALDWNNTSTATSYNVKRSTTSGGSYATIASGQRQRRRRQFQRSQRHAAGSPAAGRAYKPDRQLGQEEGRAALDSIHQPERDAK